MIATVGPWKLRRQPHTAAEPLTLLSQWPTEVRAGPPQMGSSTASTLAQKSGRLARYKCTICEITINDAMHIVEATM
jgi:hypothetical protein